MHLQSPARARVGRVMALAAVALALAVPAIRAQTAEEFRQMKSLLEQMQKTVEAQNARIAELEKAVAAKPALMPGLNDQTSPSLRTLEKVAAGGQVGRLSPVVQTESLNDTQDAASRPGNYTLDPQYKGFIPVPNTFALIKFNAKPRLDVISDNENAGSRHRFVPALFPLEGDAAADTGAMSTVSANATQLRMDVRAPELDGNFRFYYQNDFFGSDSGDMKYRLQHIYGQYHGFKAGFTYGVWEDPDSWPDTIDYEGPNAVIFARRPVAQYTVVQDDNWSTTFGVEKPDFFVDANTGGNVNATQVTRSPDLGMNLRYEESGFGHVQFSTTLRDIGVKDDKGEVHRELGWGFNLGTALKVSERTTVQFLGVYGEGVGGMGNDASFFNSDAAFDAKGDFQALPYWSLTGAVTHRWNEVLRSTLAYGYVNLDNTDGQSPTMYHTSQYASANLVWQLRKQLSIGLEGLYGTKTVRSGATSADHIRVQMGMVYSLFE